MDKPRHPHVVRTWKVERVGALHRPPSNAPRHPKTGTSSIGGRKPPGKGH